MIAPTSTHDSVAVNDLLTVIQTEEPGSPARDEAMLLLLEPYRAVLSRAARTEDELQEGIASFIKLAGDLMASPASARNLYFAALNGMREERLAATAIIRVPMATRTVIMRYLRIFDGDLHAAGLAAEAAGGDGLSYGSFMAGVRALRTIGLLEPYHNVPEEAETEAVLNHTLVHDYILPSLKPRERDVIELYYGFYSALRYTDLAAELGVEEGPLTDGAVSLILGITPHRAWLERQRILAQIRDRIETGA